MKTLLKEPLLHFLLLGAALFYFYLLTGNNPTGDDKISLSENKIAQLQYSFEKTRQRPPNKQELDALIHNYFKEEVAYKKGVEMGLLENDSIIQKRIQQKLEFIIEDATTSREPSDAELSKFLTAHSDDYRSPQIFNFTQLYFDPSKHQDVFTKMGNTLRQVMATNEAEQTSTTLLPLSDNIYLEYQYTDISHALVARYFGSKFANTLTTMPMNTWQKAVESGYGWHLVKLTSKEGGQIQPLAQVQAQVKKDWLNEQRRISLETFYQKLFAEYQVD